jgi:hypothetical protein
MKASKSAKSRFSRNVQTQASQILCQLNQGRHFSQIPEFAYCRGVALIFRLSGWCRLICFMDDGVLRRYQLLTHEQYNHLHSAS